MAKKIVKDSQCLVNDLANDCISRKAAIDALSLGKEILSRVLDDVDVDGIDREKYSWGLKLIEAYINDIEELPSAQPERNRGKWIEDDDGWDEVIWRCSECDAVFTLVDGTPEENEYYFCPHCGADMRGEQDDSI